MKLAENGNHRDAKVHLRFPMFTTKFTEECRMVEGLVELGEHGELEFIALSFERDIGF